MVLLRSRSQTEKIVGIIEKYRVCVHAMIDWKKTLDELVEASHKALDNPDSGRQFKINSMAGSVQTLTRIMQMSFPPGMKLPEGFSSGFASGLGTGIVVGMAHVLEYGVDVAKELCYDEEERSDGDA